MESTDKAKIQRYEKTRIVNLMGDIEDITGKMFQESHPVMFVYWANEILEHTETRSKISLFRCKMQHALEGLQ